MTFFVWGFMYFVLLTIEKLTGFTKKIGFFGHIYTMLFVIIGWVIFRASDLPSAFSYLKTMFGIGSPALTDGKTTMYFSYYKVYLAAGILCSFPILRKLKEKFGDNKKFCKVYRIVCAIVLLILFVAAVSFAVKKSYNPFIYFNF
jgi:alginate O-acetyltransferase complex protein AlgI